jgi:ferredoxin-NADP reductase
MKIKITMKDPDVLQDAIEEAVKEEVKSMENLSDDEKELVVESRKEKASSVCGKWFRYGEYLTVEVDTENKTCVVLEKGNE